MPEFSLLFNEAKAAAEKAYAPYSGFLVGAAALLSDGSHIIGSNQENAAYPSGLCAERVCLFSCGAYLPEQKIKVLAIAARPADGTYRPVTPCGACRQVMIESENRQKEPIILITQASENSFYIFESVSLLLPFQFNSSQLL